VCVGNTIDLLAHFSDSISNKNIIKIMRKIKLSIVFLFVLLTWVNTEAKPGDMIEDFEIGHISGRRSVIVQGGVTVYKVLGGRGVLSYSYAHSTFFQSRPFVSLGWLLKEHPNIALGYNMGFSLADNGKNFCIRLLTGPAGMMEFPRKKVEFNLSLVGEIEMELGLGRRADLLIGGGARYIFFKSRLGRLAAHTTVGLKFNF
jgi:hypothetical protein